MPVEAHPRSQSALLQACGLSKAFGGVTVLRVKTAVKLLKGKALPKASYFRYDKTHLRDTKVAAALQD